MAEQAAASSNGAETKSWGNESIWGTLPTLPTRCGKTHFLFSSDPANPDACADLRLDDAIDNDARGGSHLGKKKQSKQPAARSPLAPFDACSDDRLSRRAEAEYDHLW